MRLRALAPLLAASLAACAAAAPGYVPEGSSHQGKLSKIKTVESGTVTAGTYEPSADERKLDCRRLTGSIHVIITRLRASEGAEEPSFAAATTQRAVGATFGATQAGLDKAGELARERARAQAYNTLLVEKKCKQVDLAAELAKPSSTPPPPPAPTVSGKKS